MGDIFGEQASPTPAAPTAAQPGEAVPPSPPSDPASPAPTDEQKPQVAQTPAAAADPSGVQPGTTPVVPSAVAQSPQFDLGDPHQLANALGEHEAAAIEQLATVFRLKPEELEALETNVGEAIPKLLARVGVHMQRQFLTQLGNLVPRMIQSQQQLTQAHEKNASKFYAAWPSIDRNKHGDLVTELGIRYRKMFPGHSLEDMIQNLGPMVLSAAKLPITGAVVSAPAQSTAGTATAPAPKPNGFVPAAPGSVVQTTQIPDDPFGYMGLQG